MGRKIAGNRDKNVPTFFSVAPSGELPDSRFQNLVSMEAGIFAQYGMAERGDQRLRRMAEREMPCHQSCREIDLSLPVEGIEQGGTIISASAGKSSSCSPSSLGMRAGGTLR